MPKRMFASPRAKHKRCSDLWQISNATRHYWSESDQRNADL